jgi:hypothetical protein
MESRYSGSLFLYSINLVQNLRAQELNITWTQSTIQVTAVITLRKTSTVEVDPLNKRTAYSLPKKFFEHKIFGYLSSLFRCSGIYPPMAHARSMNVIFCSARLGKWSSSIMSTKLLQPNCAVPCKKKYRKNS